MEDSSKNPLDQVYRKDPSIVARQIGGEMLLVPIRKSLGDLESIYMLNETALFAWQMFDGECTLAVIRDLITNEFEVDKLQAEQDLIELVEQMEQMGALIKV